MSARDDYPLMNERFPASDGEVQRALDEIDELRPWKIDATEAYFRLEDQLDKYMP